ncbi:MAG TPA: UBP-type zinc finger domain-containing protein [Pyrinomonadaceae bacterium]|nr:UBP-type zinc finger domain-containing protein [Pyrinomonadaceae bacterium]
MAAVACSHLLSLKSIKRPTVPECEECVRIGSAWLHLRTCQTCGATLCCDSSPNRHASTHARTAEHPVIASAEPGERWVYCFVDDSFGEY